MSLARIGIPRSFVAAALLMLAATSALAAKRAEVPAFPNDVSPAGLRAMSSQSSDPELRTRLPEYTLIEVQRFIGETRSLGLEHRSGRISGASGPLNVLANTAVVGDVVGETQGEVAVAVNGDTVIVGWNDSRGFVAGNTVSSYAYSTNGGASFVDGGNMPLALPTDQAFGDPGIDTDDRGNWYYNQIYTRTAGNPGPTAQQNIGVHHGRFIAGVLVWDSPTMASIGTTATGNLDKCLLATDRVTGNVYVSYTRFTANPQIEIVRSTTLGATWGAAIILDNSTTPTSSKQAARPFCGPAGEVYVVWEKGANSIFCPDGGGNIPSFNAQIGFTRSLNFGVSYDPFTVIGSPVTDFLASGPGDLRERGNEFPDIGVDRSGGTQNGNIYVTWHTSAPWTVNTAAGPVKVETGVNNNNPGTPDLFVIGDDATGAITPAGDLDYWQFSAVQGQDLMIDVLPQGWNCGVTGTTRQMRVRLFATQTPYPNPTGFPDSLLAASFVGSFENRITWTAPKTGTYLIRLQISGGTTTGTYIMRVRPLTFAVGQARDSRDVVVVRSSNQGVTFTPEQRVNDDAAGLENRRPFISVDGLGHVHCFWHDSRLPGLGSNAALTAIAGTTSRDGGVTWSPNYCVTDELSFFSFNTLAIPNLGDYNTAASSGTRTHPAWTDQRISTGDVRTPGTNTYAAGRGPEAYTTSINFNFSTSCPPDTVADSKTSIYRLFTITNTGNIPDSYVYSVTDNAGWIGGPINGNTGQLPPGGVFTVKVSATTPADCTPPSDAITFAVTAFGEKNGTLTCVTNIGCSPASIGKFLQSSLNPSQCGDKVVFTATLTQSDATGSVNFFSDGNPIGSAPVVSGVASISIATLSVGSHSITAVYKGDGGHQPTTSNKVDQVVTAIPTTTTLLASPTKSECGGKVDLTATVDPAAAEGTVNFFDGANPIGSATLSGGVATLSTTFTTGTHSLTAVYKGGGCYGASTSDKLVHETNLAPSVTNLTSDFSKTSCGGKVTFTASVIPAAASGTVNFFDSGNPIGSAPLAGGSAQLSISTLAVGTHSITATYKGDACYAPSNSNKIAHEVNPASTTTDLTADLSKTSCGQKVTFTASVTPAAATGNVNFFDGGNPIGSAPVAGGSATLSISTLAVGMHSITATYKGDACYAPSNSNKIAHLVNPLPTSTTLASDTNPVKDQKKVTFTATVNPAAATGEVNFFDGTDPIGSGTLSGGMATLSVSDLSQGDHSITAVYKGEGCYGGSTSNKVIQQVVPNLPPTVLVKSPNGGEILIVGSVTKLIWNASDDNPLATVDLYLSRDGKFGSYEVIALGTPNDGTYDWTVTPPGANNGPTVVYQAFFKVVATDNAQSSADNSDAAFAIYDLATDAVLSLFQANPVTAGIELRWQFTDVMAFNQVTVERSEGPTGPWSAVASEQRRDGEVTVALDRSAASGKSYYYQLSAETKDGQVLKFGPLVGTASAAFTEFSLGRIAPNPATSFAKIDYTVAKSTTVRLSIIDVQGRVVSVLADGAHDPGLYHATWNGTTKGGGRAPVGIYFARYEANGKVYSKRVALTSN